MDSLLTIDLMAMLADFAQLGSDGKMTIVGAGWNHQSNPAPFAICGQLIVPWSRRDENYRLEIDLTDQDLQPVIPEGHTEPIHIEIFAEPTNTELANPGIPLLIPFALNFAPMEIAEGNYLFLFTLNDDIHLRLPFKRL